MGRKGAGAAGAVQAGADPKAPKEPVLNDRGEMLLPLDGQLYALRPSWKAIVAIEEQLRPLPQLAFDAERSALSLTEMAVISAELMRAYALANPQEPGVVANPDVERLCMLIAGAGIMRVSTRLMVVLSNAVTGGYTPEGELKPATEKMGGQTTAPHAAG